MPDEAERPERGGTHKLFRLTIRHLSQPIRPGACLHPTGIGNDDQQRCRVRCYYSLVDQEGQ